MILHARGIEHQSKGVENCLAVINIALATGNLGREGAGPTMITGQGNGQGGREHGQKCDQLPGQRSLTDPAAREHVAQVWGIRPKTTSAAGLHRGRDHGGDPPRARSRRCSRSASTRWSRCRTPTSRARRFEKLEFFGVIDFFLSETAHYADVVLAGSLHEEEEGVADAARRDASSTPEGGRPARRRALRLGHHLSTWRSASGKAQFFPFESRARSSKSCAKPRAAASPTTTASPTRRSIEQMGVFWPCPTLEHPGNAATVRRRKFFHARRQGAFSSLRSGGLAAIP